LILGGDMISHIDLKSIYDHITNTCDLVSYINIDLRKLPKRWSRKTRKKVRAELLLHGTKYYTIYIKG